MASFDVHVFSEKLQMQLYSKTYIGKNTEDFYKAEFCKRHPAYDPKNVTVTMRR